MMEAEDKCDLCGGRMTTAEQMLPGYQAPATFAVLDCSTCHTMVANPCKTDKRVYDAIYAVPGGPPGYDRNTQLANAAKRSSDPLTYLSSRSDAFWAVGTALASLGANRVLEIGCGLGHLTHALRARGYDAQGIDLSTEAVAKARAEYGDFYAASSAEALVADTTERFDAIVMVEVIEHLEDPVSIVRSALQLLKPGGSLVVTTPNRTYFGYDAAWTTDLPPVHLWWFSEQSMHALAVQVGCGVRLQDFSVFNAQYPPLIAYASPREATLDEHGAVIRREHPLIASSRRLGVLHETHWYVTAALGKLGFRSTPRGRRSTLAALFTPSALPAAVAT